MAAGTPRSAKNARVRLNNITCYAMKWNVKVLAEELDTTNFEGSGQADRIGGIEDIEFRVEGWWDSGKNNFDESQFAVATKDGAAAAIEQGATLTNTKLYTSGTTSPYWDIASALITDVEQVAEVKGLLTFAFTAKGKAGWVGAPIGNV